MSAKEKYKKYEKEISKVIKDEKLFVLSDIFAFYTGIRSSQFYNLKLEKSDVILKAIDDNKVKTKQSLKMKWLKSEIPVLQIAVFKTICTEEEAHRLNGSKTDNTNNNNNTIKFKNVSKQFKNE